MVLTLFQAAARSVAPAVRTLSSLAQWIQPQSMLVTQMQPLASPLQKRAFTLSAVLEKRKKRKPHDPPEPICGKCPRELPIKFPLCEKHVPCQPKRKPKCANRFPRCKPPNNCKFVDPRKVAEANAVDAEVQAQLKEEKRIRGEPGYPPKKKKKKHPNVYAKDSCPKKLCP